MHKRQKKLDKLILLLIDIICIAIALSISYVLRYGEDFWAFFSEDASWVINWMCIVYVFAAFFSDPYHHFYGRGYLEEFASVVRNLAVTLVIYIVLLYLTHLSTSFARLLFAYFIITGVLLIYGARLCYKSFMLRLYKQSKFSNRMLLVAELGRIGDIIEHTYIRQDWYRMLAGIVLIDRSREYIGEHLHGYEIVCSKDELVDYVMKNSIDEVLFGAKDIKEDRELKAFAEQLERMGVTVYVGIEAFDMLNAANKRLMRLGSYAVMAFSRNEFSDSQLVLKRLLDVIGGLVGMVIFGLAFIIFAPLIKAGSEGPVIFGQRRVGKNGRIFKLYKFRSMYVDAEDRKRELMQQNEMEGPIFKIKEDPRITKIGRFMRRTSIDELPQFWNVLCGDMSLVGTRPPTLDEYERYTPEYRARLSVPPGITGLWQISGRNDIKSFDDIMKLDMDYIDNWNIMKDIKILIKTVVVVFKGRGAE